MKTQFLILIISLVGYTSTAQQLSSGDYTISISKLAYSNISGKMYGEDFSGKQIEGISTIKKKGNLVATQNFTFLQLTEYSATLYLEENERSGNTLVYDYDTKKFEIEDYQYKAKKSKTTEDIILSGVLAFAQWLDEE